MIIKQALELKKELDKLRPLSKDDEQRIMDKFRLDWNYHSNNLEGNSLTYGETKALILHGSTAHGKPLKDHIEIKGHNEAVNWILDIIKQETPLTENFIRSLHEIILKEEYYVDAKSPEGFPTKKKIHIGQYKTEPNHVETKTGEIFRFASPEETPAKMNDLITWFRKKKEADDVNPIFLAAEFHYRFILIHPFDDGNGRTVRILMNFILMQFGFPPVIIKTEDKTNYLSVLELADAGEITPFIEFIATNLVHSLEIMIKGAKGESIKEDDDLDKELALLKKRMEGLGREITIPISKKVIFDIIYTSIFDLESLFIERNEKFDLFYIKSNYFIAGIGIQVLNYTSLKVSLNKPMNLSDNQDILNNLFLENGKVDKLALVYDFKKMKQLNLEEHSHRSRIEFSFDELKYTVKSAKLEFTKRYGDFLSKDEMKQLVDNQTKLHKNFIQLRLKEIEDKNNNSI